jgi:hypothetical protein
MSTIKTETIPHRCRDAIMHDAEAGSYTRTAVTLLNGSGTKCIDAVWRPGCYLCIENAYDSVLLRMDADGVITRIEGE